MAYLPGYTGHVAGVRADSGRRVGVLAGHNSLAAPPTPTAKTSVRLDDLEALSKCEVRMRQLYPGLPLPILRTRLDHTPTPTRVITAAHCKHKF